MSFHNILRSWFTSSREYNMSQFSKQRHKEGILQVYDTVNKEWLYWHHIEGNVYDDQGISVLEPLGLPEKQPYISSFDVVNGLEEEKSSCGKCETCMCK